MGWFEVWKNRIQRVNRLISGIGAFFLIPLMSLTTADVLSRNFFNRPIAGAVEMSEYLLSIFILLGLAYAQQAKAHVGVSLVTSRLSRKSQLILLMITTLISLAIAIVLTWQGLAVGLEERTVSDMLRIPQYPFRLLVAVAAFMTCLELVIDFGMAFAKLTGRSR
jgi:TRAP-type C4-dicarboxylate transport system permease small subunit